MDTLHPQVRIQGEFAQFSFPYDPELVDRMRGLNGSYDKNSKIWSVLVNDNIEEIFDLAYGGQFQASEDLFARLNKAAKTHNNSVALSFSQTTDLEIKGLKGELRPFQKAGVVYLTQKRRALLADEMGLGKTVQSLATLEHNELYPTLVVCPASLKINWLREVNKWLNRSVYAYTNDLKQEATPETADIIIINYELLNPRKDSKSKFVEREFKAVIFDESHYLKNHKSQRTKAATELAYKIEYRFLLSGTPIVNRPSELISQLNILNKMKEMGGWDFYIENYCGAKRTNYGLDISSALNLDHLNENLRKYCMLRRAKKDVLTELPDKQRTNVPIELSNLREYQKAEKDIIRYIQETAGINAVRHIEFRKTLRGLNKQEVALAVKEYANDKVSKAQRAETLVRINTLRLVTARGKIKEILKWVENFLASGESLILFAHHKEIVRVLAEQLGVVTIVTGDQSDLEKQFAIDSFQSKQSQLIICSLKAAGTGITLTAASNVGFIELDWTPAGMLQAEDRAHRMGQKNSVNIWNFIAARTIDERMLALIEAKREIIDAAIEGKGPSSLNILNDLIHNYGAL